VAHPYPIGWLYGFRRSRDVARLSRRSRTPVGSVILHETLPLALLEPADPSATGPSVLLSARPCSLRLRRELPSSSGERVWLLELEVELPAIDPERLLAECEEYVVDGRDGRQIGVVERVETSGPTGEASALLVSGGWFGRRRLRVDVQAVEVLVPAERRVIVDESRVTSAATDSRPA
jgi:hypothetical protein